MPPDSLANPDGPHEADSEAIAEQVFTALADPSRRAILAALAAGGPATATDLALRLPITRQAIAKHLALLAEAGLVTPEPGERRRVRYRLHSAPMQVAQQFLAALARDWDGPLDALRDHLDLLRPIYRPTAAYGHFGRDEPDFTWERTDQADRLREQAGLGESA